MVTTVSESRVEQRTTPGVSRAPRDDVSTEVVRETVERTADQRFGRAVVLGGLTGVVLMGAGVFVMGLAVGAGPGGSLGLALFCAWWGGLGFGVMLGAVTGMTREERRARDGRAEPVSSGNGWL